MMKKARWTIRLVVMMTMLLAVKPGSVLGQATVAIAVTNTPATITTTTSGSYFVLF